MNSKRTQTVALSTRDLMKTDTAQSCHSRSKADKEIASQRHVHHLPNALNAPLLTSRVQPYSRREAVSDHLCLAV